SEGKAYLWDVETGEMLKTLEGNFGEIDVVAFTPDSKLGITAGFDSTIRVWDLDSGKLVQRLQGESIITSLAVSPDGNLVVAGNFGGNLLWFKRVGSQDANPDK